MDTKKAHVPVFIGSTYEDLKDYRQAVQNELIRLETVIKGMEYFGSTPNTPLKECLKKVNESKIYIGIFAMRYGSIEETSQKSFTQLEYKEAQRLNLPSLIYIIDENNQPILPKYVDTGIGAEKLLALKKHLTKTFTVSYFTTPDDLARKIANDLPRVIEDIIEQKIEINSDNEEDFDVFIKFLKRPQKYYGREISLKIRLSPDYYSLSHGYAEAFGLKEGSAIFTQGEMVQKANNTETKNNKVSVLMDGEIADWYEENSPNGVYNLRIRLLYANVRTKTNTINGIFIDTEGVIQLLVLDIPKRID